MAETFSFEDAIGEAPPKSGGTFSFEEALGEPAAPRRGTMRTGAAPYVPADDGMRPGEAGQGRGFVNPAPAVEPPPAAVPKTLGGEVERLGDSFFSGVDSARAGLTTLNAAAQANQLQQAQERLRGLEQVGQGNSPEANGIRQTIQHYAARLPSMAATAAEAQGDAQRGSAMATTPATQAVAQAKTFGEAWEAFKQAPYEVISGVTAQSLPTMLPALITGAIAGPAAGAATMGLSSGAVEAGSSLGEFAQRNGVDVRDPRALEAFFSNPQALAEGMKYAGTRAGIIGTLDAASGGLAGKTLAPAMRSQIGRQAVNLPTQMGAQAALGAGGEAGAQLATEGRITEPGQVFLEAAGELGGAPTEVASFGREARAAAKEAKPLRPTERRKQAVAALEDVVAEHGLPPAAVEAAKKQAETMPLAEVPGFFKRFAAALGRRMGRQLDDAALSGFDQPAGVQREAAPKQQPTEDSLESRVAAQYGLADEESINAQPVVQPASGMADGPGDAGASAAAGGAGVVGSVAPDAAGMRDGDTAAPGAGDRGTVAVGGGDAADQALTPRTSADITGEPINRAWRAFTPESGTLNLPREQLPQIKAEHRGALVQFLAARGITHETDAEVDPTTLKPTQGEFSPAKVQQAREYTGGDRSILVSSDGYVLDGHHQWLARLDEGQPVKVIRLNAPIQDLLRLAHQFPSSTTARGPARRSSDETQDDANSGVPRLAARQEAVQRSEGQGVPQVRGQGDQDGAGVGERLQGVLQRGGAEAEPSAFAGSDQGAPGLRAGQRALGDKANAGTESPGVRAAGDAQRQDSDGGRVGARTGDAGDNDLQALGRREAGRTRADTGAQAGRDEASNVDVQRQDATAQGVGAGARDGATDHSSAPGLGLAGRKSAHDAAERKTIENNAGAPAVDAGVPPVSGEQPVAPAPSTRVIARAGRMPNSTEPLELRPNADGTLTPYIGKNALVDYDSGEPIVLPADVSDFDAKKAIRTAGAVSKKVNFYPPAGAAEPSPQAEAAGEGNGRETVQAGRQAQAQEVTPPAPAKPSRAERAKARMALDPEKDSMLEALAKLGGIQREVMAREFGLKPEELKHTVATGGLRGFPFRKTGGMGLDGALTALREAGYFMGVADEDVRTRFEEAVYNELGGGRELTPQGTIRAAEEARAAEEVDLGALDDFTPDDLEESGYADLDPEVKAATQMLLADAERAGIDTETIKDNAARATQDQNEDAYHAQLQAALREALQALPQDDQGDGRAVSEAAGRSDQGDGGAAGDQGGQEEGRPDLALTSPTRAEVLAQQDAKEQEQADREAPADQPKSKLTGEQPDMFNTQGSVFDAPAEAPTPAPAAEKPKAEPPAPQQQPEKAEKQAEPAPMPAVAGIPRDVAQRAHAGTSHTPEVRAGQEQESFMSALRDAWARAARVAGADPAAIERITEVFKDVAEGYRTRYLATLGARSRVMSSMIVGPARFPVERNRKRMETEMKRAEEAQQYLDRGIKRLMRAARGPIDNSPESELERVRLNLSQREELQETMKAANAALRKGDDEALRDLGFDDEQIAKLKKGDFSGRKGFPDYKLTNNNAEIRRLRERLKDAEARMQDAATGPAEREVAGVRVVEDATADRIRLYFNGKPSEEVRDALKTNGFRWSPKEGAWQRQLTDNARRAADAVLARMVVIEKPSGGDVKFSLADAPFYSELARQVERVSMNAAPAVSWKAWLRGLPQKGVKPDEIAASGIVGWLDAQPGKISKQQILSRLGQSASLATQQAGAEARALWKGSKYDQGTASSMQAAADAAEVLGFKAPVPVRPENRPDEWRTPMRYDLDAKVIYYNTAAPHSRVTDVQQMIEEYLHAVDHLGALGDGHQTISTNSARFLPGGDLRAEIEASDSAAMKAWFAYPLAFNLAEDRKAAELFARAGVFYHGFPALMRAATPNLYATYERILGPSAGDPSLPGEVRQPRQDAPQVGRGLRGDGRTGPAAGRGGFGEQAGRLGRVREAARRELGNDGPGRYTGTELETRLPGQPDLPAESKARAFQRKAQDQFNRFTVVRQWAQDQGIDMTPHSDVWAYEERMHGRIATRVEDFREKTVAPKIKAIQKAGFTMEQVAEYLHAQHAEERNEQIESIEPNNKAGSGMETAAAQAILAAADPKLAALANDFRKITEDTKAILLRAGIISKDMVSAWEAAYQHYVPLKGGPDEKAAQTGTGKGLTVAGKQKRALGHGERTEYIVENILRDHERAITLAEKNRVGHSLLSFIAEIGREDVATVGQPEKRKALVNNPAYEVLDAGGTRVAIFDTQAAANQFITKHTGGFLPNLKQPLTVNKVKGDPSVSFMSSPMLADNEVMVYVKGHALRVQLNDPLLARAYTRSGQEGLNQLMAMNREINNYLSRVYTGYNPEFLLTNIARDMTTGLINNTGKFGAKVTAKALSDYPRAFAHLWRYAMTGRETSDIKDYRAAGGSTGASYLSDIERIGRDVQDAYDEYRGVVATYKHRGGIAAARAATNRWLGRFLLAPIRHINEAGENAMRLAVFQAVRDTKGYTVEDAASAAKNVTVNFNRRGEWGQVMGAMYLFFNPAIQGTAAIADSLFNGKHKGQTLALTASLGVLAYMLAAGQFGGGDDDDEAWKAIPDYVKDKNIVIRTGEKTYITIPIPYGYGFFYALGNAIYDLSKPDRDIQKVGLRLASALLEHFSPVGNPMAGDKPDAKGLVEVIPGAVGGELQRDLVRLMANRSGMGGDIVPDSPYDQGKPDALKVYRSTKGTLYDKAARAASKVTGGTDSQAGGIDVSPETLKYWAHTVTGGAGAFISDSVGLAGLGARYLYNGDDPDKGDLRPEFKEIPILRRFYKEEGVQEKRRVFWSAANEVKEAQADLQRAKKLHDDTGEEKVWAQRGELIGMGNYLDAIAKMAKAQRDLTDEVMADESTSLAYKRARIRAIEKEERSLYDEFTREFSGELAKARAERAKVNP